MRYARFSSLQPKHEQ
jgi:hypothetical protein